MSCSGPGTYTYLHEKLKDSCDVFLLPSSFCLQAAVSQKGRVSLRSPISSASHMSPMGLKTNSFAPTTFHVKDETSLRAAVNTISMALKPGEKPIVIGLAADSGCGKSTFMRRVTALFGGKCS